MEEKNETTKTAKMSKATKKPTIKATVNCERLNVRKNPSMTADVTEILTLGTEVIVNGEENDFCLVNANGVTGYCKKEFLVFDK